MMETMDDNRVCSYRELSKHFLEVVDSSAEEDVYVVTILTEKELEERKQSPVSVWEMIGTAEEEAFQSAMQQVSRTVATEPVYEWLNSSVCHTWAFQRKDIAVLVDGLAHTLARYHKSKPGLKLIGNQIPAGRGLTDSRWKINRGTGTSESCSESEEEDSRMSPPSYKSLQRRCIVILNQARELQRLMEEYGAELERWSQQKEEATPDFDIFNACIDKDKLADCFYAVYEHFFGLDRKDVLKECDKNRFAAYLYILVLQERLGNDIFKTRGKRPFYHFICAKVVALEVSDRQFTGYLNHMKDFCQKLIHNEASVRTDDYYENYAKIAARFRNTSYYRGIKHLRRGVNFHKSFENFHKS